MYGRVWFITDWFIADWLIMGGQARSTKLHAPQNAWATGARSPLVEITPTSTLVVHIRPAPHRTESVNGPVGGDCMRFPDRFLWHNSVRGGGP